MVKIERVEMTNLSLSASVGSYCSLSGHRQEDLGSAI